LGQLGFRYTPPPERQPNLRGTILKNSRGFARQALGGWTLVGIFTARTGTPFSIFDTNFSANAPSGAGIPRYVPSAAVTSKNSGTPVNVAPNDYTV